MDAYEAIESAVSRIEEIMPGDLTQDQVMFALGRITAYIGILAQTSSRAKGKPLHDRLIALRSRIVHWPPVPQDKE